jgi:hypothetical protein
MSKLLPEPVNHWLTAHPRTRIAALTFYYLAIIVALIILYGRGDFSTPPFVYQDF